MGRNIPKNGSHQVIDEETRAQRGSEADCSHAEDTELLSRDRQPAPEPALSARKWDALVSSCPGPITGAAVIAKDRTLLRSATPQLPPWLFDVSLKRQPPESLQVVTLQPPSPRNPPELALHVLSVVKLPLPPGWAHLEWRCWNRLNQFPFELFCRPSGESIPHFTPWADTSSPFPFPPNLYSVLQ